MYGQTRDLLKEQLRWPITDRRIASLRYVHDKKVCTATVGQLENQNHRYEIVAIYESSLYIVYTRAPNGAAGVTILVAKEEVTDVEDFDA